jgi:phenylpropionate dioxygenase-like ring-hydroxylating dioxygenase large terminal subunit
LLTHNIIQLPDATTEANDTTLTPATDNDEIIRRKNDVLSNTSTPSINSTTSALDVMIDPADEPIIHETYAKVSSNSITTNTKLPLIAITGALVAVIGSLVTYRMKYAKNGMQGGDEKSISSTISHGSTSSLGS